MGRSLDEFKQFVKVHPKLDDVVKAKSRSWQEIYEEWTFYKDDDRWNKYKDDYTLEVSTSSEIKEEIKEEIKSNSNIEDMMKNALAYVKKINPDTITKTVTNAQKLLALVSGLGIGNAAAVKNSNTGDPLFDKRFDEWY